MESATSQEFSFPKQEIISSTKFQNYTDQQIKLSTQTDKEAPLVLANIFYPGWLAYVDGQKTPIRKVDFMFDSVVVPEGNHIVEFKFKPRSFYNGLYISTISLIATILIAIFLWKRKYQ